MRLVQEWAASCSCQNQIVAALARRAYTVGFNLPHAEQTLRNASSTALLSLNDALLTINLTGS
jgi:hypothetical protein